MEFHLFKFMQGFDCRASMDSLMKDGDCGPSLRSRGVLLHSAATAQSTMDYSTMAIDEGVVDSPINKAPIPRRLESLSPIWPVLVPQSPPHNRQGCTPTKRTLYDDVKGVSIIAPFQVLVLFPT